MRPLLALGFTAAFLAAANAPPAHAELLMGGNSNPTPAAAAIASSLPRVAAPSRRPGVLPTAKGFGEQISLRFAARQIVPSDVALAIADNVDTTTNVSWQGGRPWNQVLLDVLKPLNLRLTITSNTALISR